MYRLWLLRAGARFKVMAWGTEERCEVVQSLKELALSNPDSHKKMRVLIDRVANYGVQDLPPKACRMLGANIFELKEQAGNLRIFCFFDPHIRTLIIAESVWGKGKGGKRMQSQHIQMLRKRYTEYLALGVSVEEKK